MMHMYRAAATERGETADASQGAPNDLADDLKGQEDAMDTWLKNLNFDEYISGWSSLATSISTMDIGPGSKPTLFQNFDL